MKSALELALADYDGRHAEVLQQIVADVAPTAAVLRQAVRLTGCLTGRGDAVVAKGASYVLWAWLTEGAKASPRVVADLADILPRLDDKWVMLHVVRCVPLVRVEARQAKAFAAMLQRASQREFPFLRAWSVDSMHKLSLEHPSLAADARRMMEAALDDEAPSVRKIVSRILSRR